MVAKFNIDEILRLKVMRYKVKKDPWWGSLYGV